MTVPSGLSRQEYSALPGVLQLVDVVGERVAQEVARAGALEVDDAHVRDVEHPGVAAHRAVLVDLGAVVDRHVPAAEIDHARAGGAVDGVRGCLFQHAHLPSEKAKGRSGRRASPRLSFYLRDCGASTRRCPFGGSPSPARPLSRCELRPRSPCCLSDCGSCAFGGAPVTGAALSCTDPLGTVGARLSKRRRAGSPTSARGCTRPSS